MFVPHDFQESIQKILETYPHNKSFYLSPAYVYFGVIVCCYGRDDLIGPLYQQCLALAGGTGVLVTRAAVEWPWMMIAHRLRKGLLKGGAFFGFPRVINGLQALNKAIDSYAPAVKEQLDQIKPLREVSKKDTESRGKAFFDKIYQQHSDRILQTLNSISGGDLGRYTITSVYGKLLAEFTVLDEKETALLEFVACFATGVAPQAKGHMYGARNLGNSRAEIEGAIAMCRDIAKVLEIKLDESGMDFVEKTKSWS